MIFYVTVLRALAAILITNARYNNVYPIEIIANGGLLGDVIFFAVSGFGLYNIKDTFTKWYKKRIIRIYPTVWIITIIYLIIGFYNLDSMNLFELFIYPTYYHFVASIIVLYIIYYIIIKCKKINQHIPIVMLGVFCIQLLIYIFTYDKSYYHIDVVREYMIRFLFLESMLLGALYRKQLENNLNKNKVMNWIITGIFLILYFVSKLLLTKGILVEFQIINQIILFILLFYILKSFAGINNKLEKLPKKIKDIIQFIASITLEIYLVQYPIIPIFAKLTFPMNWIIITSIILISAYVLHILIKKVMNLFERKIFNENINNRSFKN